MNPLNPAPYDFGWDISMKTFASTYMDYAKEEADALGTIRDALNKIWLAGKRFDPPGLEQALDQQPAEMIGVPQNAREQSRITAALVKNRG